MFANNRVLLKDNLSLTDISAILSDPYTGDQALTAVAAEDALYLGSDMPFNHRFLMLSKKNTVSGTLAVKVWDGSAFTSVEDVQDLTSIAGVPFARNGILRFTLPKNVGWGYVYDSSEIDELSALSATMKSKANYWIKVTFSGAFDFELRYVGFRFARDADLKSYYPDLLSERMMTAFNAGVPMQNWDALHVVAAEEIIKDLRAEEIVWSPNQVLDPETFTDAACHKMAEMAFKPLGKGERRDDAMADYKRAMAKKVFNVDKNGNGRLDVEDKQASWRLTRV